MYFVCKISWLQGITRTCMSLCLHMCFLGSKPDRSKTGGKHGLKITQDPDYRRYGNTVDMDSALETFLPHRWDWVAWLLSQVFWLLGLDHNLPKSQRDTIKTLQSEFSFLQQGKPGKILVLPPQLFSVSFNETSLCTHFYLIQSHDQRWKNNSIEESVTCNSVRQLCPWIIRHYIKKGNLINRTVERFSFYSSSPQHIEECCGWLRQKVKELNAEQLHIVQQHQEQVW